MIDEPQIARTDARPTAVIRLTIPREEIRSVMGPAISEVMALVGRQGIGPVGPVFSHHFRIDPKVFDFEVGVPVKSPVTPAGRVEAGGAARRDSRSRENCGSATSRVRSRAPIRPGGARNSFGL